MRIVSLLPSTTEIVYAIGLEDQLVGVTHECDYPPEAQAKPALTRSILQDPGLTSAQIDATITDLLRAGHNPGAIYHIDAETLRAVQPDLILTQQLCDVCAVSFAEVQQAVASTGSDCRVISLEPASIEEILGAIIEVGAFAGAEVAAGSLVSDLRDRIAAVTRVTAGAGIRRRVWCAEWLDPPFGAGHWVPEQVRLAGGLEVFGRESLPSQKLRWEDVLPLAPEVVVLMPCGYDLAGTLREVERTAPPPGWNDLPAVRAGRVYAVDGSAYFSRPGPRVVDGLEMLAHILHPERIPAPPAGRMAHLKAGASVWAG